MSNNINHDPEEKAFDALLASAFRKEFEDEDVIDILLSEPRLSAEDLKALEALGSDVVERIVAGDWASSKELKSLLESDLQYEYTAAMHRSSPDSDITENARLEMEKKIRELEDEDDKA